jgi:hypothetical protein
VAVQYLPWARRSLRLTPVSLIGEDWKFWEVGMEEVDPLEGRDGLGRNTSVCSDFGVKVEVAGVLLSINHHGKEYMNDVHSG